jgi:aromatic ring hydroxylase
MPKMKAEQYEESLRGLNLVVYMFGKQLDNVVDDPIIRPSMLAVAKTYEMAHRPGHCRRVEGDHAFGDGLSGTGNSKMAGEILYGQV